MYFLEQIIVINISVFFGGVPRPSCFLVNIYSQYKTHIDYIFSMVVDNV